MNFSQISKKSKKLILVSEQFKTSVGEVCAQIQQVGLKKMEFRRKEIEDLLASREEAIIKTNEKCLLFFKLINIFTG